MATPHFQTFIDAFAAVDQRSRLLAGDEVLCPPSEDFGCQSTPRNAVTFASMGVDGVHYAILKLDGQIRDDSPVVRVSPMDSDDLTVIAESFLSFLAIGCGVSAREMQSVFDAERSGEHQLVGFLSQHFDRYRLLGEERRHRLTGRYEHLVERTSLGGTTRICNRIRNMLSPNLATVVLSGIGKYWRWVQRLDGDSLEALLWAIGEFASRWTTVSSPDGRLPEPRFYPHSMAEDRMRNALKILAKLHSVGRVELNDGRFVRSPYRPFELSEHASAFSSEYRERLYKGVHTAWAQGLDERTLGILLWMVGEYGVRVNSSRGPGGDDYPPPSFDAPPDITKPMRVALRLIAKIERGEPMTSAEISRRIAKKED